MPTELGGWLGDIHQVVPAHWAGLLVTVAAVVCGGLIGIERERAQKPAGMRTMILICLGAAIFAQASILLSGNFPGERTRIAAQIVTGIGFLGAGAIIREGGLLIGLTTAAAVWATAAVGVVLGGGYVATGVVFTLLILGTLTAARVLDRLISGPCRQRTLRIIYDPTDGRMPHLIQGVLDDCQQPSEILRERQPDGLEVAMIRYCHVHRDHRAFLSPLLSLPNVLRVEDGE